MASYISVSGTRSVSSSHCSLLGVSSPKRLRACSSSLFVNCLKNASCIFRFIFNAFLNMCRCHFQPVIKSPLLKHLSLGIFSSLKAFFAFNREKQGSLFSCIPLIGKSSHPKLIQRQSPKCLSIGALPLLG